jgi:hypothetical protein
MSRLERLVLCVVILLMLSCGSCSRHAHRNIDAGPVAIHEQDGEVGRHHTHDAVESMTSGHHSTGPHIKWTELRPSNAEDAKRADQIVHELRHALLKYRDYRVALKDGFEPFLPHIAQPKYHFTKKWYGFKAAFGFDPAEPTSLLYKKTASGGYELIGAMYTAPKRMTEDQLHERVPLSVAQWHAHVNICLPPRRDAGKADWTADRLQGRTNAKLQAAAGIRRSMDGCCMCFRMKTPPKKSGSSERGC